ncbi:hypothetical protein Tco_0386471 [Tanacetum coccineum]
MFPLLAPTISDDRDYCLRWGLSKEQPCLRSSKEAKEPSLLDSLEITPIDQAHPFVSPPSGDAIMDFVNELGYPEAQISSSSIWGIITNTNVDYAELMWEEFVQAMQTFLTDKANLGSPTKKGQERQTSPSPFHLAEEDLRLGNLKFVSKGEINKVFGMPIPNELISNNIRNASYYNAYLEMVAKHDQKVATKKEGKKKFLVDEPDEEPAHSEPELVPEQEGVAIQEPIAEVIRPLPVVEGKGKAIVTEEQAAQSLLALHTPKRKSITNQFIFQRQTPATKEATTGPSAQPQDDASANIICDSPSIADVETGVRSDKTSSVGDTEILQITEELDPGETHESRPLPTQVLMDEDQAGPDPGISHVALAGPDPKPTHDEFMTDLYPKVQESLKFPADEHVLHEDPLSSTKTLSSIKNLEDAYAIGEQFINDKSTDDELGKLNVEAEVVSMVTVLIYQASSSVPPLSTPVIDLLPPKPASSTTQTPIFIATTMTTTTPLPPPPQQQSTTESELAERVTTLEKKLSDLEQTNKNLDNTTQNLGSRVYTFKLRDLPHKINEVVRENVKEVVQIALQAPLRDRFRDLPEEDMKEMLHQRMFESGTYKSLPEHIALYEALEASMARAQRDEFLAEKNKLRKRRRDYQDPPPPPPDLDLNKRRRHDTGSSDAPSSSSKQQSSPYDEQPVEDIPIPDSANISDSEDTGSSHLPHVKPRPEWLKPILEDDRPATLKLAWVIPTSHVPDVENTLKLTQAYLESQAYEVVKPFYLDVVHLQFQMEECHKIRDGNRSD